MCTLQKVSNNRPAAAHLPSQIGTHFNLYLNLPTVGARYIVPQTPSCHTFPDTPHSRIVLRTDSVSLSYQIHFPLSPCISRPCASLPKNTPGGIPILCFHSSATRDLPQSKNGKSARRPNLRRRSQVFFPLPPSAHPALYFRAKGDSYVTD